MKMNTVTLRSNLINIFTMIILSVFIILSSAVKAAGGEITYELYAGEYEIIEDDQGFHRINMLSPGYGAIQSPGNPVLPEKILKLRVPQDVLGSSVNLTVEIQESVEIPDINIIPNPPMGYVVDDIELPYDPEYEDWGPGKSIVDGKNMYVYGKDANYPEEPVEYLRLTEKKEPIEEQIEEQILSRTRSVIQPRSSYEAVTYVVVAYRPFLYNPVTKKLTLIKNAIISINYETSVPTIKSRSASDSSTYDYVIITTDDIVSSSDKLDNFVYLKEFQGHTVRVVTDSDFAGLTGQPPNGTAEKIRQWLINNYFPLRTIDYVLLIGNPDPDDPTDPDDSIGDIPMKMCLVYPLSFALVPTDYFYADLSGNWDLDGDQYFGENLAVDNPTSPNPIILPDTFSARWTGKVMCDFAEDYQFRTVSDDGVRLWIDGVLVIDNWTGHLPTTDYSADIPMTVGKHDIVLEFRDFFGHGLIRLFWKTTDSDNVKLHIIPADHLYDVSDIGGGLTGTYYNNAYLTDPPSLIQKDSVIDFIWGTGDVGVEGVDSGADVFVGRIPVYNNNYNELDAILEKIIKYETDSGDISWRESILLPMVPLWDDTPSYHLGEGIKDDIAIPSSFDYYRIYNEDYSSSGGPTPELWPCTYNNILGEWQNGYGMVVWATHGWSSGASSVITSGYAPYLDDGKPSFTFHASCSNGHPETSNNLGYALLKHGAIATVSSSRVSWEYHGGWSFNPLSEANHNIAYYYTKKVIDDGIPKPAGAALYLTKGDIPAVGSNAMDYNLYGEPDCYLLTTFPNSPPVADADGPYEADEGSSVSFDASSSYDPEGDSLEYRWDFDNNGSWDTGWSSNSTALNTWCDDHTGIVVVEVSDQLGLTDEASTVITVNNVAPTVDAGPDQTANEGDILHFNGGFSDPGCDSWNYEWDFGDSSPLIIGTLAPTHVYCDNGVYTVTLKVTDDDEGVGLDTLIVTVNNVAPTVDAGPDQTANEGDILHFNGGFSDPGCDTWNYEWDFGDGSPILTGTLNPTHAYGDNGIYTVTLTVIDDDGGTGSDMLTVTVFNVAPTAVIDSMTQPNPQFILPIVHTLTFNGSFIDPGWLDTHISSWDFGDGTIVNGTLTEENEEPDATGTTSAEHTYSEPGNYTVSLTVTDDDGGTGSDMIQVTVVDAEGAKHDINDYIQGLPDYVFISPANQRKNAFANKFNAIDNMFDTGNYQGAINKLQNDIREKCDGLVDGNPNNDWIRDQNAQEEICMKIDDLVAYLEYLSGSNAKKVSKSSTQGAKSTGNINLPLLTSAQKNFFPQPLSLNSINYSYNTNFILTNSSSAPEEIIISPKLGIKTVKRSGEILNMPLEYHDNIIFNPFLSEFSILNPFLIPAKVQPAYFWNYNWEWR